MHFSDRHASEDDLLSKVLLYSVLLHYALVYLFFGNPFLLLNRDDGAAGSDQNFDVQLLNFPMNLATNRGDENKALVAGALRKDSFDRSTKRTTPTTRIPGKKEGEDIGEIEKIKALDPKTENEGRDQTREMKPSDLVAAKNVVPQMPSNMTGPEDCMLKLIGMVCPEGKIGCISAYREFCASLRD